MNNTTNSWEGFDFRPQKEPRLLTAEDGAFLGIRPQEKESEYLRGKNETIEECINAIDEMNGIDIGDDFDLFVWEIKKRLLALRSEKVDNVG